MLHLNCRFRTQVYELLPMLLLGVVGGLLGSAFIALNAHLADWRKKHLAHLGVRGRVAEALAISVLTSAVSFILPLIFACQVSGVQVNQAPVVMTCRLIVDQPLL